MSAVAPQPAVTRVAATGHPLRRLVGFAVVAAIATVAGHGLVGQSTMLTLDLACVYAIAALGLNVIFGLGGLLSIAQAAIMAVGAYTLAIATQHSVGFVPAVLLGCVGGAVASAITGIVGVRVRSHYFILASLALAEGIVLVITNQQGLTGGSNGLAVVGASTFLGLQFFDPGDFFLLAAPLVFFVAYLVECLRASRFGLALKTASADEYLASAAGMAANRYRVAATIVGGACAGLAGALLATLNAYIGPQDFGLDTAILLLMMIVLGGVGSNLGTLVAAVVLTYITHGLLTLTNSGTLVYGAVTLGLLLLLPGGLAAAGRWTWRQLCAGWTTLRTRGPA